MRKIIIISILITLAFSYITFLNTEKKVLVVSVSNAKKINNVENVLLRRFNEYPTSLFYNVESKVINNNIEFTFSGGIPEANVINKLINTKGKFEIKATNNYIIVTNNEVDRASSTQEENISSVSLQLSERGAKSMNAWTSRNIGKDILVVFDGKTLSRSRVTAALGKRIQFTLPTLSEDKVRDISMLLRTGSLESKVTLVE